MFVMWLLLRYMSTNSMQRAYKITVIAVCEDLKKRWSLCSLKEKKKKTQWRMRDYLDWTVVQSRCLLTCSSLSFSFQSLSFLPLPLLSFSLLSFPFLLFQPLLLQPTYKHICQWQIHGNMLAVKISGRTGRTNAAESYYILEIKQRVRKQRGMMGKCQLSAIPS